jgi:hypothetical protein
MPPHKGVYEMEIHLHIFLTLVLDVVRFTTLRPYYGGWGLSGVAEMVWTQFRFSVFFIFYLSYFLVVLVWTQFRFSVSFIFYLSYLLVVLLTNYPAF